ncbi:MAG: tRNA pseudouridine(55) synthase TruB [Flavobacteriaceae bacterium]|nr:tRNA pseudouridine(55) synthase TruB [Flavobacteriaceae bacterium]MDB3967931.1 tRNA pseudouridine(55) synthase TruB [Flavobacteriaceae bacterium]
MDFFKQHFTPEELIEGKLFLINKPLGWTSFQVVNKLRWHLKNLSGLKKIKVGHAGTLDPLATGLLLICTGKKTKSISTLQETEKEYTGTFLMGATTPSYDLETSIDQTFDTKLLTEEIILKTAIKFTGEILQYPPVFSALKKNGKRLYEYARAGEDPEITPRTVNVHEFKIIKINLPKVDFLVRCSKGTYIRSLAHDFGKSLSNGAHLSSLKRTRVGNYKIENAFSMESEINLASEKNITRK